MTPQLPIKGNPAHGALPRCAQPIPRACPRQHRCEDARRAAHGSQPGRLFISLPVDTNSADSCSRTISAQHEIWRPTNEFVSAGTDSVMFRVVPCASTCVKTSCEIRVNFRESPRIARRARACLWQRMEACHA